MCSVIGAIIREPKQSDFDMIRRVFHESRIRGLHATGMSAIVNNKIVTYKEPVPADKFTALNKLEEMVNDDGVLYLIGHCRYSTSDLQYNQPIANSDVSVAHNGVLTQELPERWEDLYGYKCTGKNDSELLLHTVEANNSPLQEWKDSSLAVCELYSSGILRVYRNGKRPLYLTNLENGCIITSTSDIPKRANLGFATAEVPLNTYLTFDRHLSMDVDTVKIDHAVDYQHYDFC